jgi:hypothetical protein
MSRGLISSCNASASHCATKAASLGAHCNVEAIPQLMTRAVSPEPSVVRLRSKTFHDRGHRETQPVVPGADIVRCSNYLVGEATIWAFQARA